MNLNTDGGGECDCLVIGSGAAGMAAALILARAGRKVRILEKARTPGGSLQRFTREGVPFDTGFHFTADLRDSFGDMLSFLGLSGGIVPVEVRKRFYFAQEKTTRIVPHGIPALIRFYSELFPAETEKIRAFFAKQAEIYRSTPLFYLTPGNRPEPEMFPESDFISYSQYAEKLGISDGLKLLLAALVICCCGTPAPELSMSALCRIGFGLDTHLVRFEDGGNAVIRSFLEQARTLGIRIDTGTEIARIEPEPGRGSGRRECHRIVTNRGETITFRNCILTIHPKNILKILGRDFSRDFTARVDEFSESCGFFTFWALVDRPEREFETSLTSYFPQTAPDGLLSPEHPENTAGGIMLACETDPQGRRRQTLTMFQNVYPQETAQWNGTFTGKRPKSYADYKLAKIRKLEREVYEARPDLEGRLKIVDSASMLTYRDYLCSTGSAYGIRQKAGQFNVFGRLPVRNFYAAGQNSLLPGAFGAMQSSFLLCEKLLGKTAWRDLISAYKNHTA